MDDSYKKNETERALHDFYRATGLDMALFDTDFTPVCAAHMGSTPYCRAVQSTEEGRQACALSDRRLLEKCRASAAIETAVCHAGLLNVAIPLLHEDTPIGYLLFGRIRTAPEKTSFESEALRRLYRKIPPFDEEKTESLSHIATMLAKYVLLKNTYRPPLPRGIEAATAYIKAHLDTPLSVAALSQNAHVSKSALYKGFRLHFGCTVSEYIHRRRVERAREYLEGSELSMEEISQRVGFSGAAYFSRIFKKQCGLSPLAYRKSRRG